MREHRLNASNASSSRLARRVGLRAVRFLNLGAAVLVSAALLYVSFFGAGPLLRFKGTVSVSGPRATPLTFSIA